MMAFKVGSEVVAYSRGMVLAAGSVVAIVKRIPGQTPTTYLVDDAATGQVLKMYGDEVVTRRLWLAHLSESKQWQRAWRIHLELVVQRKADLAAHGVKPRKRSA